MASSTQCVNKKIAITKVPWGYKDACLAQIDVGVYTVSEKKWKYNLKQDTQFKGGQSYKLENRTKNTLCAQIQYSF